MNQTQRQYALSRIEAIRKQHAARIGEEAKLTPSLTLREKIILIRGRKAIFVKPDVPKETTYHMSGPLLVDCYRYPREEEIDRSNAVIEETRVRRMAALDVAATKLRDSVILSDGTVTVEDLNAFERMTFD